MSAPRAVDMAATTATATATAGGLQRGRRQQFLQPALVAGRAGSRRRGIDLLQHLKGVIAIQAVIIVKGHVGGLVRNQGDAQLISGDRLLLQPLVRRIALIDALSLRICVIPVAPGLTRGPASFP